MKTFFISSTSLRNLFLRIPLALLALFVFSGNSFAGTVNLAWDPSASSNVGGYKVAYGTSSGSYTSTIDVGNKTSYSLTSLQDGAKYYFAVKAYDTTKTTESAYSNEINAAVPTSTTTAITAAFTPSAPISVVQNTSITFTDTTTGTVTSRKWDLPGSNAPNFTSTAQAVTVSYPNAGTYNVTLTVNDSASTTKAVTVTAAPTTPGSTPGSTSGSAAATEGLVAAYGFEEASGTTVIDNSGNGNNGSVKEAVRVTSGRYGSALDFDGVNDWVTVNDSASLDLSDGMTIEAWIYPQSQNNDWQTIVMKETSNNAVYYLDSSNKKNLPEIAFNDGSWHVLKSTALPLNQWTHLVGTYDGQYQRLYANGVEVANRPQTGLIPASNGVLRIGGSGLWGEYFNGKIDELRIYNRALTATEVKTNLASPVSASSSVSTQALYRVNAGGELLSGTPAWSADSQASPSSFVNAAATGNTVSGTANSIDLTDPSLTGTVPPMALFQNGRFDGSASPEMQWNFPVTAGGTYEVRLYFAEVYSGNQRVGARVFDVLIEGAVVLNDYDVYAQVGGYKGVMESFTVTPADSTLTIDFRHVIENPHIKGIEIVQL